MLSGMLSRMRALFFPGSVRREIDEEMRFHLDRETERRLAMGLSPQQADLAARRSLGNLTVHAEAARAAYGRRWLDVLGQDLRYALRTLRRSPGVTAGATISLALAIGASTAVFGALDALLLRRLPVQEPGRLVTLEQVGGDGSRSVNFGFVDYEAFRSLTDVFQGLYATTWGDGFNVSVSGDGGTIDDGQARVSVVTGNYFSVLGVAADAGRLLTNDDDRDNAPRAAVISAEYRDRRLGGVAEVVGRTITMQNVTYTIVGVAARGFRGDWVGWSTDVWVPVASVYAVLPFLAPGERGGRMQYKLVGRLADGVTLPQAQAVASATHTRLARAASRGSAATSDMKLTIVPAATGYSSQRGTLTRPLLLLMTMVGGLLLIACANVANLLLARSLARGQEIAMRLALGAGRARIVRQLFTESVVLAIFAATAGLLVAEWGVGVLDAIARSGPRSSVVWGANSATLDLSLTGRALVFTILVSVVTVLLFGVLPAFQGTRVSVAGSTRLLGRGAAIGRTLDVRDGLMVVQVALALVLLSAAALLMHSLTNLKAHSPGFARDRLLLVWTLPGYADNDRAGMLSRIDRVQQRLASLPGVEAVSTTVNGVFSGAPDGGPQLRAGAGPEGSALPLVPSEQMTVGPGFFATVGQRLISGRGFQPRDTSGAVPVAIVDEGLARRLFGTTDVVGREFGGGAPGGPRYSIVGVVADAAFGSPRQDAGRTVYFPHTQARNLRRMCFVVRVARDPASIAPRIREALRAVEPMLPVLEVDTVNEQLDHLLFRDRLVAKLSTFFGAIALILACVGIYSVVAFVTAHRTGELGLRMALGATPAGVVMTVLRDNLRLVSAGIGIGLVLTIPTAHLIRAMLYGTGAMTPLTVGAVAVMLAIVGTLASLVPAIHAARVDPVIALRST